MQTLLKKSIGRLFIDEELLDDPASMEDALMKQLKKLKGLEDRIQLNLNSTGNMYYATIAESLNQLSRINPEEAPEQAVG